MADALISLDMVPRQFIFISTLGTFGPIREARPFQPIGDTDSQQPNTDYGRSKRMAEEHLITLDWQIYADSIWISHAVKYL